jgi:regulator of PEP synthase PpsR (kinase-PPPase family)
MIKEDIGLVRLALSVYHTRTVYPGCVEAFERLITKNPENVTCENLSNADERQVVLDALDELHQIAKANEKDSYQLIEIGSLKDTIRAALQSPRVPVIEILETVLEQAEDEGLWFNAKYASEAYLQQELRRLHAIIERAYAELSKTKEPSSAPPQKGV